MPSSSPPALLSAARVWYFGLLVSLLWVVLMVLGAGVAGWVVAASLAGISLTLGLTWLLARIARRVSEHHRRLEEESHLLQRQLNKLLSALPAANEDQHATATGRIGSLCVGPASWTFGLAEMSMACDRAHRLLRQLNSQRAQMAAVFQNLDSGVIVVDPQGRVSLVNPAAKKFFSISRQPLGQPLVESTRQPEMLDAVRQVLDDGSPREVIFELRDEAGIRRVLRVFCVAVHYEQGVAVLLAARDESEARLVEEMRREFVANVSHELKTPLAAIKGYAETVELAISDDREAALHFLSQIHEQCRRLERLIADMMTLARAQAGAQHLRPTTVELDAVIAESIATYAPLANAKTIRLEHRCDQDGRNVVYADREATLTIANNVIGNAIRYTPQGGHVIATTRREGSFGVLVVRDDGIGIPEHEQKRVFERFYRADKSRHHSNAGTGLGLAIVKNLTHAQGGRVHLQSRPGHGSTFEIYLPATPSAPSP